jgi:glycosyltransferase involved in cell wall biosynthesis
MSCVKFDILISTFNRQKKLERCLHSIFNNTYKRWNIAIQYDVDNKFAFSFWNYQYPRGTGDWIICLSDDTELYPDCLEKLALRAEKHFPDTNGFIGINQVNIKDGDGFSESAQPCLGRKFLERFNGKEIFCPDYLGFGGDAELGFLGKTLKRFVWCEEAKLYHYHPCHHPEEMDDTHNVLRKGNRVTVDNAMYKRRRELGYLWGQDFNLCGR